MWLADAAAVWSKTKRARVQVEQIRENERIGSCTGWAAADRPVTLPDSISAALPTVFGNVGDGPVVSSAEIPGVAPRN